MLLKQTQPAVFPREEQVDSEKAIPYCIQFGLDFLTPKDDWGQIGSVLLVWTRRGRQVAVGSNSIKHQAGGISRMEKYKHACDSASVTIECVKYME